jgi:hypothetical protein
LILAVADVNGCRYTAWVHGAWRDFLGEQQPDELLPALLDYARESAIAGHPVHPSALSGLLPPEAVAAVRATVAVAELETLVGNTAEGLGERLLGERPLPPFVALREALVVAVSLPLAVPVAALAAGMRLAERLSPPLPEFVRPPEGEANLVVHMLAEAVPAYLSNALVRAAVLAFRRPLVLGVRAEGVEATVRIGRDEIVLGNGLDPDAVVILDGGVEVLLDAAARAISRDLTSLSFRRPR